MAVSREFVIKAYLKFLERSPESEEVISRYIDFASEDKVVSVITRSKEYFKNKFRGVAFEARTAHKILMVGNCQVSVVGRLLEAMSDQVSVVVIGLEGSNADGLKSGCLDISSFVSQCTSVVVQNFSGDFMSKLEALYPGLEEKLIRVPAISYSAFHPDMGYVNKSTGGHVSGPTGDYHSMIALWAWENGLNSEEALSLYRHDVYEFLGYFNHREISYKFLLSVADSMGFPIRPMLSKWLASGCFMHSINHPKINVLADVGRYILGRLGINYSPGIENYIADDLAVHPCWGVYPEIARKMFIDGAYMFKLSRGRGSDKRPAPTLTLTEFVRESFAFYDANKHLGMKPLINNEAFSNLANYLEGKKKLSCHGEKGGGRVVNPYAKLKSYQMWRRSVGATQAEKVDPVVSSNLHITRSSRVATAGSCFAQHISRTLSDNGFTYYVSERGDGIGLGTDELEQLNYGVFSARYGNIYTSRQLIQLFDRAYGKLKPIDEAWVRKDGAYVDPFRPMVNPLGHTTAAEVEEDRKLHLKYVRDMFENLDVFIFTLGLTESWRRLEDGAVFPLAPGVAAGSMDESIYEFVNFETHEVIEDLEYFLAELAQINPAAKVIFTVSPVPLVATYEDRHVLTSTTYSKSALRSAADYIVRRYPQAEYFPSYEIITGNYIKSAYYESDLRSVREEGVSHVMRLFMEHYSSEVTHAKFMESDEKQLNAAAKNNAVICDEEALDSN